ncbi:Tubby-related protein 2 [Phytophthora ramorum]|uniref:Tubby-related protein 2 n=1 Tax=Phytophthora ramorum TaxID=164328 RepID=UPI00309E0183|nr:Tubby-related protein 2 [Phytophthora ramorum]
MFMSGSSFDDDAPSRGGSRGRKGGSRDDDVSDVVEVLTLDDHRTGSGGVSAHPNSLKDDDLEGEVGGAEYLSGARSNVIQQQRELQKKKLQERMGGGVVRTSLPKQYSAPRSMDVDERPSRFGRDDDELDEDPPGGRPSVRRAGSSRQSVNGRGSAGSQAHSRRSRDDDDDDDDVRRPTGSRTAGTRDWERDRERDRDYDRDYDRERERGGGSRERDRDRGGRGERGYSRDQDRDRERGRGRDRDRDDSDDSDRDRSRTPKGARSGSRRGKDYDDPPPKGPKRGATSSRGRDDDDGDRRGGPGGRGGFSRNGSARGRSHSRSRSRSKSRSRSRSQSRSASDASSDDDRNRNAATSYDPSSNGRDGDKGRAAAANARKPKLDIADMRAFILRPIPKAYDVVECYIERNKSGANKMFPEYCLYMKEGDRFLLTAKKRPKNRTSNYLVSLQRGDLLRRGSDNYVGKLRANFLGTEFTIYDSGSNPKDADQQTITSNPAGIRQELGISMYAANVLGHRGPRKMKVCVPRVREDGTRVVWRPLTKDDEMVNKCKEQDHTNLTYLINKPPRWNDQVCAYVLNFNGRVTMASVKNFQLVTPEDQETVVLQFGRVGKDLFTMDFRWPLCPLQAFAITLSSFDSKLACDGYGAFAAPPGDVGMSARSGYGEFDNASGYGAFAAPPHQKAEAMSPRSGYGAFENASGYGEFAAPPPGMSPRSGYGAFDDASGYGNFASPPAAHNSGSNHTRGYTAPQGKSTLGQLERRNPVDNRRGNYVHPSSSQTQEQQQHRNIKPQSVDPVLHAKYQHAINRVGGEQTALRLWFTAAQTIWQRHAMRTELLQAVKRSFEKHERANHGFMTKAQLKEALRDLGCVFTDDQITALFGMYDKECVGTLAMSDLLVSLTDTL